MKLYESTEVFNDTIPGYRIGELRLSSRSAKNLPERYKEALLEKIFLILKETKAVIKGLNLN